jgi:ABC-type glycerol-3-phosphate transport system substrate-binding protein
MLMAFAGCTQPPKSSNKIILWHWMVDRDATLKKLAQEYKSQTGIDVAVELFAPSDAYSQKIISAAQAKVLPDIYGVLDKKSIFALFIKEGLVADLTSDLSADNGAWSKSLFEKALEVNHFENGNTYGVTPGIYGVSIDVTHIKMLYNKKLLAKANIRHLPDTFDEFINDAVALRRIGITPFVSGWGELWLLDCFASNYAFNIMDERKIFDTFRGIVPYTDPDWIKVFDIFRELRDKGVLMDGIVTKGNKYAEHDFALERAAFSFDGSWCVNVYKNMNPGLDYGVISLPPISNERPLKIWAGGGSSFVVNNRSPNKDKAITFLKWLTSKDQQIVLANETNNLPSNKEAILTISPLLRDFAKDMDVSTHPMLWPLEEYPLVKEALNKGIQSIILGEKTPLQVAEEVQKVKTREMAKYKK